MDPVVVLVTLEVGTNLDVVREAVRGQGFEEKAVMPGLGILYGLVEIEAIPALRRVSGVKAVELERQIQVPTANGS
jgi:hypothetical protein